MNAQKTLLSHVDSQPKSEEVILWYDSKEYTDKRDAMIVSAVRTPIGDFGGSLKGVSHTKLASLVMDEVCRRANFPKEDLHGVYWGIVMPRSGENGVARAAALEAGIPDYVSTAQLNRACCSSMEAIRIASMAIRLGEADAIIAGGGGGVGQAIIIERVE